MHIPLSIANAFKRYDGQIPNININKNTKVMCQGATGKSESAHRSSCSLNVMPKCIKLTLGFNSSCKFGLCIWVHEKQRRAGRAVHNITSCIERRRICVIIPKGEQARGPAVPRETARRVEPQPICTYEDCNGYSRMFLTSLMDNASL